MDMDSNLEEYSDPILYDLENNEFEPDGPCYLALAQRFGGPVLEIGCGTGRITIPLAQHGVEITGLDLVPQMLEHAQKKAGNLPVRWVTADARAFSLGRRFRFIFESGATFQHMLDRADQEAMLARVCDHLEPQGYFAVSLIFPHPEVIANVEAEQDWYTYLNEQGQEVRVSGTQHYDTLSQIKTETAYRRWRDAEGKEVVRPAPLKLRFTFPQEMETLLSCNKLVIVERYGDTDFSPLTTTSKRMIYVCHNA